MSSIWFLILIPPSKISRPHEYYNFKSQTHGSWVWDLMTNSQRRLFFPTLSLYWHAFWLSCGFWWIIICWLLLGLQSFECPDIIWGSDTSLFLAGQGHFFCPQIFLRICTLENWDEQPHSDSCSFCLKSYHFDFLFFLQWFLVYKSPTSFPYKLTCVLMDAGGFQPEFLGVL